MTVYFLSHLSSVVSERAAHSHGELATAREWDNHVGHRPGMVTQLVIISGVIVRGDVQTKIDQK